MKRKTKSIIGVILLIATLIVAVAGISAISKKETKKIGSREFSLGAIDIETGAFMKSDTTLCTKEKIACVGLEITPEFESTSSYQIYWYNMDDNYIGYTKEYSNRETFANAVPRNAWYCRIVITPSTLDEDGKEIKDFKIKWYEVYRYANDIKVTVDKKQGSDAHNIYTIAPTYKLDGDYDASMTISLLAKYGGSFIIDDYVVNDQSNPNTLSLAAHEDYHAVFVDLSDTSKLYIENKDDVFVHLYSYSEEDGTITKIGYYNVAPGEISINEPGFTDSDFAVISLKGDPGLNISVYDYFPREIKQIG